MLCLVDEAYNKHPKQMLLRPEQLSNI